MRVPRPGQAGGGPLESVCVQPVALTSDKWCSSFPHPSVHCLPARPLRVRAVTASFNHKGNDVARLLGPLQPDPHLLPPSAALGTGWSPRRERPPGCVVGGGARGRLGRPRPPNPCAAGPVLAAVFTSSSASQVHSMCTASKLVGVWPSVHTIKMEFTVATPS